MTNPIPILPYAVLLMIFFILLATTGPLAFVFAGLVLWGIRSTRRFVADHRAANRKAHVDTWGW